MRLPDYASFARDVLGQLADRLPADRHRRGLGLPVVRVEGRGFHRAGTFRLAEIGRIAGAVVHRAPVRR